MLNAHITNPLSRAPLSPPLAISRFAAFSSGYSLLTATPRLPHSLLKAMQRSTHHRISLPILLSSPPQVSTHYNFSKPRTNAHKSRRPYSNSRPHTAPHCPALAPCRAARIHTVPHSPRTRHRTARIRTVPHSPRTRHLTARTTAVAPHSSESPHSSQLFVSFLTIRLYFLPEKA